MTKEQAAASLVAKKLKGEDHINTLSRDEILAVPYRGDYSTRVNCDAIILVGLKTNHDSGYRHMDFVAVKNGRPVCTLSGCSDVLNINGIGGCGHSGNNDYVGRGWSIDCLPKSGLMHLWCAGHTLDIGSALSSLEIFAVPDKNRNRRKP